MPNRILENGDAEGFGMVFLEANACGKPVIGGRTGGAVEAIEDKKTGFLVDPNSLEDISSKIIYILKNDDIAKSLGEAGKERAALVFDWERSMGNKINLFKKFMKV